MKVYENIFRPNPRYGQKILEPVINKQEIERFLGELQYPLYFLTTKQWWALCHISMASDHTSKYRFNILCISSVSQAEKVEHREYLHKENTNPAPDLAKQLVEDMGDSGSIITWNMRFEKSVNEELGRMYPNMPSN